MTTRYAYRHEGTGLWVRDGGEWLDLVDRPERARLFASVSEAATWADAHLTAGQRAAVKVETVETRE